MKKYIFPLIVILTLIACFIVVQQAKKQHSSIIKNYDQKFKELNQQNKQYQVKYSNYKHFSDSIKSKYVKSDFDLKNLIGINRLLKNRLYGLVHSKEYADTGKSFFIRDSLKEIAFDLADSSTKSDSLCLDQINRLESISAVQESQIEYCDSLYNQTMSDLKSSLEKNQTSDLENTDLKKQIRRKKFIAKIEGVAILITATFLTTILLTH
jgi:hypothetical protein